MVPQPAAGGKKQAIIELNADPLAKRVTEREERLQQLE
jgi:hypothetical protein